MRKNIKEELLGIIKQLDKMNEVLQKYTHTLSVEQAVDVLTECQQSAIAVGRKIDELEGEGTTAVSFLEEYCEEVYGLSANWGDTRQTSMIGKRVRLLLDKISNSIQYELPDSKKEIVFLPYKAAMWDSLESVWKKVKDDENCEVYVIPIPYFDKNSDGTFREAHYEGDLYPDYVPITHYDDYNFKERHPDEIFIHNPYDEWNYVTSVHPFFYSKNLKQFTDRLVYIPYFVLDEISPDNQELVEKMKSFCILPGVIYADKVIVQSENMRQIYINILTKEMGANEDKRKYWEEKIDGSGSPKMDRIVNTLKADIHIPEEWNRIIKKADGTNKKIVFYNICINPMLKYGEQMLEKIKTVLALFKENKEEIVLLWRPHPLMESTIVSMRPQLWDDYKKIKDNYLAEGWGIYDDTPDIDRAIILSDAYYGDESSVVSMYKKTGKLIMIQNVES